MPTKLEALALDLHRSGVSQRRIARDLGLTLYAVRKLLDPDFRVKHNNWCNNYRRTNQTGAREYLRKQARLQADEEGVPHEEVYVRFGVPTLKRGPRAQLVRTEVLQRPGLLPDDGGS
jgi:hypothetical protein